MYAGVPAKLRPGPGCGSLKASPKSPTYGAPLESNKMFAGLMSR
jgi:hypothetical protein